MTEQTAEAIAKALRSAGRPANLLAYMREVGASDVNPNVVAAYLSHCADLVLAPALIEAAKEVDVIVVEPSRERASK